MGLSVLRPQAAAICVCRTGVRIYAIGDVHGRADLLEQVFTRIDTHIAAHPVDRPIQVLVGDYIDRGPNSREVLDRLIERSGRVKWSYSKATMKLSFLNFCATHRCFSHGARWVVSKP